MYTHSSLRTYECEAEGDKCVGGWGSGPASRSLYDLEAGPLPHLQLHSKGQRVCLLWKQRPQTGEHLKNSAETDGSQLLTEDKLIYPPEPL